MSRVEVWGQEASLGLALLRMVPLIPSGMVGSRGPQQRMRSRIVEGHAHHGHRKVSMADSKAYIIEKYEVWSEKEQDWKAASGA